MKKFTSLVLGVIMCVMMGGLVLVGCNKNYDDTIIGEIEQEQIGRASCRERVYPLV